MASLSPANRTWNSSSIRSGISGVFRIGDACLYDCFEIEPVNLDIFFFDRKEKVGGIEQADLLRICQLWSVIGSVCDDRCLRTMFMFFETAFSYEGSWD